MRPKTIQLHDFSLKANLLWKPALALVVSMAWLLADALSGPARAATIPVTNCADSGTGSLRHVLGNISSGDIVDLSGLTCVISLDGQITIPNTLQSLTIRGKQAYNVNGLPVSIVRNSNNVFNSTNRVFRYTGSGTLKFEWMQINGGNASDWGGCIRANGNVTLNEVAMQDCYVQSSLSANPMHGGAIYAAGIVRLENGVFLRNNKVTSTTSDVRGGAIYAGGTVNVMGDGVEIIANTASPGPGRSAQGGAIYAGTGVGGTRAVLISSNIASGDISDGGGIYSNGGALVNRWELRDNHAARYGGGIYLAQAGIMGNMLIVENSAAVSGGIHAASNLTLSGSLIADNTGGGIVVLQDLSLNTSSILGNDGVGITVGRNASIENSTVSGNTSVGSTGGLVLGSPMTTALIAIDQTTISHNLGYDSTSGGGLWLHGNARIRNSTIVNNSAFNPPGAKHGTGISLRDASVQLELVSSIVTNNKVAMIGYVCNPAQQDCLDNIGPATGSGGVVTGQANLIGSSTVSLPVDTIHSDDPMLGTLEDNGGPTPTHLPVANSPAIDAGVASGFTTDQRGDGFPRVLGARADIGAVEAGGSLPPGGDEIFADGFED